METHYVFFCMSIWLLCIFVIVVSGAKVLGAETPKWLDAITITVGILLPFLLVAGFLSYVWG